MCGGGGGGGSLHVSICVAQALCIQCTLKNMKECSIISVTDSFTIFRKISETEIWLFEIEKMN